MKNKIVYFFIFSICIFYSWKMYELLLGFRNESAHDLAIYIQSLSNWMSGDFVSDNTVRGTNHFLDHQSFSMILLAPLSLFGLWGIVIATPLLAILFPLFFFHKGLEKMGAKVGWLFLLISGLFLAFHPYTQNALLFGGMRSSIWALFTLSLLWWTYWDGRKRFLIPAFILAITAKEDMILFAPLFVLGMSLQSLVIKKIL
jgi:uncharacterized membrane protein